MAEDIIRRVQIQAQADEESIKRASSVLDNFYKRYQSKSMKVDTSDFFKAVDAVRTLRKELDTTKKNSPQMEGIIGHMSSELENAGKQFSETIVRFTNGDIAKGLNEAVDKITQGLSVKSVDLGDFLSSVQKTVKETTDALSQLGVIRSDFKGKNYFSGLSDLNTSQLEVAINLMQKLKESQAELDSFQEQPLQRKDLYSGVKTSDLSDFLQTAKDNLDEIRQLNLETISELNQRKNILSNIKNGSRGLYYDDDEFADVKNMAKQDESEYNYALEALQNYISERENLLQRLNDNSNLFKFDEIDHYGNILSDNINQAKLQLQELQQIGPKVTDTQIGGDFTELVNVLNEIKTSLETISKTFQNTETSMRGMVESSKISFEGLAETIKSVYDNLTQIQTLVDTISKKDFNVTNITNPAPTSTSTSKRQGVKQLKAEVEAEMQHVKVLFEEYDKLVSDLKQKRMSNEAWQAMGAIGGFDEATNYPNVIKYDDFEREILGGMADAKTKAKIENLLVLIDGYIAKLTEVNKLREKYGLGEWQDPFAKTPEPAVQPTIQSKPQVAETPTIDQSQGTIATSNAEAQHMWQLKAAIDEVSNAIGRKNAGFVKEKEIVDASVNAEEAKLRELVGIITTEIGNALDGIKEKFTQSFTLPEINKGSLQESLNVIYQQFIKLKSDIEALKINLGGVDSSIVDGTVNSQDIPETKPSEVKVTPTMDDGAVAKVVEDNVAKTPATVKVTPIIDGASDSEQAIDGESQSAIDAAKTFVDAANAKKQFVEANKKVANSAKTSEDAVKKEAEAAKTVATDVSNAVKDLAKIKEVRDNAGNLIKTDETTKFRTDKAVVTETESTRTNKDGTTSVTTTIIKDFEKLTKEADRSKEAVTRAQKKLDEFLARFQSKSGGNAKFITGFSALEGTKVTADNMETVSNDMMALQEEYSKLETNFRKGQSSLNPFVNAITKSENIGNIFGDVERQFNGLTNKSDELVNNFTKLQELAKKIQEFTHRMNSNPESIDPKDFSEFSKQVGEFNVVKSQVEGSIKAESRIEAEDVKKQAEVYAEILRLVKERNKALATAASADNNSIKQRNALMDAYKIEQQLSTLGKQIVLTDEQRAELARIREEQARKIRDIEADKKVKADNQKASAVEQGRKKEVEDYINLIKQKNEYEAKAAKGGAMRSTYEAKVAELQKIIAENDKKSIMTQEEQNRLLAIEEAHRLKISEIKLRGTTNTGAGRQSFETLNNKLQTKHDAGYLSDANFSHWQNELAIYQSYLDGTVAADEATIQKKKESLTQLYDHLNKISNASRTFFASGGEILSKVFSPDEIADAKNSLMGLYDNIVAERFDGLKTKITGLNPDIGRLTFTVDTGKGALEQYTIKMDGASGATKLLSGNTKDALTTVQQFGKALKTDVRGMFSAFIGGMSGMYAIGRYFKQGIQAVRELDKALTELKKVTDETEATYDRFLVTAGKTGANIGRTITDVVSATGEFAKLGYDINTAASMAESALIYANVGDNVDVETGSQSIISTLKAFGVEANNTISIVDKFNEIGNNFAITTAGIGDALQVSASAMAEAGNSLDETIALTTAANTIVQNPNTVGTALKTLSLRIRGVKTE